MDFAREWLVHKGGGRSLGMHSELGHFCGVGDGRVLHQCDDEGLDTLET